MPRVAPYVPNRDSLFATWAANFSTLLTASPTSYGQSSGTASAVATANAGWQAAYALVMSPATKTKASVQAKNVARVSALAVIRPVAVDISLNAGVTAANKQAIGVNPRTSTPGPITPPTTYPVLTIQAGAASQLYVRYRDSAASPSVKSKPYGVSHVELHYLVSASAITDPTLLTQIAALTKSPALIQFGALVSGTQQAYLAGRYLLANGKYSGFGPIVSFTVPIAA